MRYLVRLVTPPGGTVLEPFAGSGTTMAAAILEGFNAIGCELTADYLPIIEGRIAWAQQQYVEAHDNLFGDNA
jgi:site-specific DNA-methyltransferase (adenine-specific)